MPAVTAHLSDLKSLLKGTREDLEQHKLESARKRSGGWHAWHAAQRESGDRKPGFAKRVAAGNPAAAASNSR